MLKKSLLIFFTVLAIIFISNVCLANDMGNNIKNTVNSGTNTVVDGIGNLAESARNGVGHVENGIEDALTMDNTNMDMNANNVANVGATGDYTTARAATTTATGSDTTTMWVWVIVAVAAIVIVALVWYYGSQNRID